ncbi:hypothetical protein PLEOSDRAFT_1100817 [Pleurotus ostreatus PC15]|uniref:Uncharacterized protein n=1 Tax=Pleurotus ostreatus (strain PC15) TaxID=1137138 RepID=A0A067P7G4_PLEO1|nr:hypothetical protein PLEOSDRAFT_1100817 [Pleurotus ostreatus PC15]
MVKGNLKSSASSTTRRKHAKKALGPPDQPDTPNRDKKPKAKEKGKGKREARVKMYIPPTKPGPAQPDPLDAMGLAHWLPPELLVVLQSLGKKAEVTKVHALEDLQAHWVKRCVNDDAVLYAVTDMLPVWVHAPHPNAVCLPPGASASSQPPSTHPSSQSPPLNTHISAFLADTAPTPQLEAILGTWCLAAHDIDKAVALSQKILDARLDLIRLRQTHPHPRLTLPLADQKLVDQVAEMQALNDDLEAAQRHMHTVKECIRASASAAERLRMESAHVSKRNAAIRTSHHLLSRLLCGASSWAVFLPPGRPSPATIRPLLAPLASASMRVHGSRISVW